MPNVVFDTMIFVRSVLNPYGLWGRLIFQHNGRYRLFLSIELATEILAVLARSKLRRRFRVNEEQVTQLVTLLEQAEVVVLSEIPAVVRDPKDDMVLATAATARADYLVTEDRDLLDDFQEYQGVRVLTAAAFLRLLEGQSTGEE